MHYKPQNKVLILKRFVQSRIFCDIICVPIPGVYLPCLYTLNNIYQLIDFILLTEAFLVRVCVLEAYVIQICCILSFLELSIKTADLTF